MAFCIIAGLANASQILNGSTVVMGERFTIRLKKEGFELSGISNMLMPSLPSFCLDNSGCNAFVPSYFGLNNVEDGANNGLTNGALFIAVSSLIKVNPQATGLTLFLFDFQATGSLSGPYTNSGVFNNRCDLPVNPFLASCFEAISGSGHGMLGVSSYLDRSTGLQVLRTESVRLDFVSAPEFSNFRMSESAPVQTPEPTSALLIATALLMFLCLALVTSKKHALL